MKKQKQTGAGAAGKTRPARPARPSAPYHRVGAAQKADRQQEDPAARIDAGNRHLFSGVCRCPRPVPGFQPVPHSLGRLHAFHGKALREGRISEDQGREE